ncbi:MAG: redoxin domain-containing protein [Parvularculaceae bacterium]
MGSELTKRGSKRRIRVLGAMLTLSFVAAGLYVAVRMAPMRGVEIDTDTQQPEASASAAFVDAFREGIKAFQHGDAHAAMVAFERATKLDPSSADAFANLGFALLEMEAWDEAESSFDRALTLHPEQANAYFGLAEVYEGRGNMKSASDAMLAFLHFSAPDDPFRRRAEAALWEWGDEELMTIYGRDRVLPARLGGQDSVHQFEVLDLERRPVSLDAYEGKGVVLNIWASWCPPCRRELPQLDQLSEKLDSDKFAVVGLNVDASPDFVAEYLRRLGIRFTSLWDADRLLAEGAFDVDAYPTTLLVAPDGRVRERIVGYQDWMSPNNLQKIKALQE